MSSWQKLKKILHTKAWKAFTNKIPLKLNRSKALIKKPQKARTHKSFSKKISWPVLSLSIQPKKFKNKRKKISSLIQPHKINHKRQLRNPVFIDQLFIAPSTSVAKEVEAEAEEGRGVGVKKQELCSTSGLKRSDHNGNTNDVSADDMWESMVLASPQMNGIDERAEEFIARFRADMHRQEKAARLS